MSSKYSRFKLRLGTPTFGIDEGGVQSESPFLYDVRGGPSQLLLLVALRCGTWQTFDHKRAWHGSYASPEEALAALQVALDNRAI